MTTLHTRRWNHSLSVRSMEAGAAMSLVGAGACLWRYVRLERAIGEAFARGDVWALLAAGGLGSYELAGWACAALAAGFAFARWRLGRRSALSARAQELARRNSRGQEEDAGP